MRGKLLVVPILTALVPLTGMVGCGETELCGTDMLPPTEVSDSPLLESVELTPELLEAVVAPIEEPTPIREFISFPDSPLYPEPDHGFMVGIPPEPDYPIFTSWAPPALRPGQWWWFMIRSAYLFGQDPGKLFIGGAEVSVHLWQAHLITVKLDRELSGFIRVITAEGDTIPGPVLLMGSMLSAAWEARVRDYAWRYGRDQSWTEAMLSIEYGYPLQRVLLERKIVTIAYHYRNNIPYPDRAQQWPGKDEAEIEANHMEALRKQLIAKFPGYAFRLTFRGAKEEADVLMVGNDEKLGSAGAWNYDDWPTIRLQWDSAATHEMGHFLGLPHFPRTYGGTIVPYLPGEPRACIMDGASGGSEFCSICRTALGLPLKLVGPLVGARSLVFSFNAVEVMNIPAKTIETASENNLGELGNGSSRHGVISRNDRFVAFASDSTNLADDDGNGKADDDRNGKWDLFVHERFEGKTTRVSVDTNGRESDGNTSSRPAISADGRYVAFVSEATNLVPGDSNEKTDVFRHDRETKKTVRVSVDSQGTQADGNCLDVSISADGRFIAFSSLATNLVPGDTNGVADVFVHDVQMGQTIRVSVGVQGAQGNEHSRAPLLSDDARFVAFESTASNLVTGDNNRVTDVFVHDTLRGITERASVGPAGEESDGASALSSIAADGQRVAFISQATNLGVKSKEGRNAYLRDRVGSKTLPLSSAVAGGDPSHSVTDALLSPDGMWVVLHDSGERNTYFIKMDNSFGMILDTRRRGVSSVSGP